MTEKAKGQQVVPINGKRLAFHRNLRKWSQYTLAEKSGVSRSFIAEIEQGRKQPRSLVANAIASSLGLEVEELVG